MKSHWIGCSRKLQWGEKKRNNGKSKQTNKQQTRWMRGKNIHRKSILYTKAFDCIRYRCWDYGWHESTLWWWCVNDFMDNTNNKFNNVPLCEADDVNGVCLLFGTTHEKRNDAFFLLLWCIIDTMCKAWKRRVKQLTGKCISNPPPHLSWLWCVEVSNLMRTRKANVNK